MAQLTVPLDAARFGKGLPWKDYMAQMGDTRARTEDNYAKATLTDEERSFFKNPALGKVKYALMLAENWCGDVHRNSPLLAHICEAMPNCEMRVFFRDQNLDITDLYLNNGYRSIPVIVFSYMYFHGKEKLWLAATMTVVAFIFYYSLFVRLLNLPFPDGAIQTWLGWA